MLVLKKIFSKDRKGKGIDASEQSNTKHKVHGLFEEPEAKKNQVLHGSICSDHRHFTSNKIVSDFLRGLAGERASGCHNQDTH
jgi:hypothetical protein